MVVFKDIYQEVIVLEQIRLIIIKIKNTNLQHLVYKLKDNQKT